MEAPVAPVASTRPSRWQLEWELCDIAAKVSGVARDRVLPTSRMVEELGFDSIAFLEFVMEIEDRYDIYVPNWMDKTGPLKQVFTRRPLLLRDMAEAVELLWEFRGIRQSKTANRACRQKRRERAASVTAAPFLQLDGRLNEREWMSGPLYEPLGTNQSGAMLVRRRTDGMRCVMVPSAIAQVGADSNDVAAEPDERPARTVRISEFLIDAEPVSTIAYARFLNSIGSVPKQVLHEWFLLEPHDGRHHHAPLKKRFGSWRAIEGTERKPMMLVSWYGANAYSLWANRRDWRAYRGNAEVVGLNPAGQVGSAPPANTMHSLLPSETQWEYAARGAEPRRYPWGDAMPSGSLACIGEYVRGQNYSLDQLPVADVNAALGMSPFGLHQMAGNVWQWCRDWYAPDFYQTDAANEDDPQNAQRTGVRSERGGSWVGPAELARCSYRRGRAPEARGRCLGFRCIGLIDGE